MSHASSTRPGLFVRAVSGCFLGLRHDSRVEQASVFTARRPKATYESWAGSLPYADLEGRYEAILCTLNRSEKF